MNWKSEDCKREKRTQWKCVLRDEGHAGGHYRARSLMKKGWRIASQASQMVSNFQHDALKKAGCKTFTDNASGVKAERPTLNEIFEFIRKGDRMVMWRLVRRAIPEIPDRGWSRIWKSERSAS